MKSIDAYKKLLALDCPVLTTNDVATCLHLTTTAASKMLERFTVSKAMVKLKRGLWATTNNIDPLILPECLTNPLPSYISLQTALFLHGIISQIPEIIYAVSLARTKRYKTALGFVSIHHTNPEFFFGFDLVNGTDIKLACPEKALLDFLYLYPARSAMFKALPEIDLQQFNAKKALAMVKKIRPISRRNMVKSRLINIL